MKKNPLMRALRMGKLSLAALEGTLRLYLHEERLAERLPLLRMLTTAHDALLDRAQAFRDSAASLDRVTAEVLDGEGFSGGGSLPGQAMPTKVVTVAVQGLSPNALLDAFRASDPPVIARIFEDRVHVDLRTVRDSEVLEVLAALQRIVS
jgi:L-seryl-tRNA(Ser) seleniumtransferase